MEIIVDVILKAGRAGVELALFTLLPVMIVMLTLMRLLEARGVLDWFVVRIAPALKPLGLSGMGAFAALQINFVSFAAPLATLTMMEQRGASDRQLAATLAMVMAMAQANVTLPMASLGLKVGWVLLWSFVGGLIAAAATWHLIGRGLSAEAPPADELPAHAHAVGAKGVLGVINHAGAEAFKVAVGAIPMLVLALVFVNALRAFGAIDALTSALAPLLTTLHLDPAYLLPAFTKYIAGGTAMMGVMDDMLRHGQTSVASFNRAAGFLVNPFD
ncbi:MAG TPA: nucleoside recognition domain-containing protein, partial [Rhodocyclaceae bacterium]|nr:nucleoside recognition domain-containing protein [Rhodocyclaceae bacterium]